jgi:hypothetical protein
LRLAVSLEGFGVKASRLAFLLVLTVCACVEEQVTEVDAQRYREQEAGRLAGLTDAFLRELAEARSLVPVKRYFVSASGFSMQEYFRRKFGHAFGTIRLASWNRDDFEAAVLPGLAYVKATVTVELLLKQGERKERQVEFTWTSLRGRWYLMSR